MSRIPSIHRATRRLPQGPRRVLAATWVALCSVLLAASTLFALPAAAHSGDVTVSQDCSTWSATVTLAHNVTIDRTVVVTTTIPGTNGIAGGHYDSSYGQIWTASGPAIASGTVTLTIWNGQIKEFQTSASLPQPVDCATPTPTEKPTPTEEPTPTPGVPTIDTEAVEKAVVGQPFHDVAKLHGGDEPAGTISFTLYGPSASPSCTVADTIGTVHVTVNGDGTYQSPDMTVTQPGTYWWIARYNPASDSNNVSVRNTCGDDEEVTVVSAAATPTPTEIAPTATPTEAPTATPTEAPTPTPTVAPASGSPTATPTGTPNVLPASGSPTHTPGHTLPNTATSLPGNGNSGQGPALPLALLAMGGLAFGLMFLKPTAVPERKRR
jgi:hypothetical protein